MHWPWCRLSRKRWMYAVVLGSVATGANFAHAQIVSSLEEILERRAGALRGQIGVLDRQIGTIKQRVVPLDSEIERLLEAVGDIEIPQPDAEETPEPKQAPPREIRFRPPLLRKVDLKTPLALVCKNGRVAILDFDRCEEQMKAIVDDSSRLEAFVDARGGTLEAGDFDMQITLIPIGGGMLVSQEAIEKRPGEAAKDALQPSSQTLRRLAVIDAAGSAIQFAVYPDSFDQFRDVRTLLWEQGYSVNWFPLKHGEKISVGGGGGGVNVQ